MVYIADFQVQQGICGDHVSYYVVEWDTSDNFNSAALSSITLDGDDLLLEEQVTWPDASRDYVTSDYCTV